MAHRLTAICILIIVAATLATTLALAATTSIETLERDCDGGRASSCALLGVMYRHGRDAPRDYARAIAYHRRACNLGSQFGCGYVGEMTYLGLGAEQNREEGAALMRAACEAGNDWSCAALRRHGLAQSESGDDVALNEQ